MMDFGKLCRVVGNRILPRDQMQNNWSPRSVLSSGQHSIWIRRLEVEDNLLGIEVYIRCYVVWQNMICNRRTVVLRLLCLVDFQVPSSGLFRGHCVNSLCINTKFRALTDSSQLK